MLQYVLVAAGGALGAMARYWVYNAGPFPGQKSIVATFVINVAGSLLIGVMYVLVTERALLPDAWRSLVSIGLLGAFTTYSTYSLDALQLLQQGMVSTALLYLFGTMLVCLLAAYVGVQLARIVV
ncbi:MAG TPA: fluoride efflux transporter CrcB [Pseudomonadales bacterium]